MRKGNAMIKQITRNEAEAVFAGEPVVSATIKQSPRNLSVKFIRSDQSALLIIYNVKKHKKSYFLLSGGAVPAGSLRELASSG